MSLIRYKLTVSAFITVVMLLFAQVLPCKASLSLSSDAAVIDFGAIKSSELNLGFKELTSSDTTYALRLTVMDDIPSGWVLKTHAETAYFSSTAGNKPCTDAKWRVNSSNLYTPYSISDTNVASGDGDSYIDLDFEILTEWTDTPGRYGLNVVFTIFEN
jgi:hypothetical protein